MAPLEGIGGYLVGTEGLYRADTLATKGTAVTGTATAPTAVTAPYPDLAAGATSGSVKVTVLAASRAFDSGFIAVSAGGRIVETADIGSVLRAGGGTVTMSDVPAGSKLAPANGVPYQLAVRAWNSSNAAGTMKRVAAPTSLTLGDSGQAVSTVQVQ